MLIKSANALVFAWLSFRTVLLSFLPEKRLYSKAYRAMESFLVTRGIQNKLCFAASGRAALAMLFKVLHDRPDKRVDTILLPDYICNAVCAAAEYAGLRVRFYKTFDYAPDLRAVERMLGECNRACVMFASLMGHCCAHDTLYAAIRTCSSGTPIIFDECQNLSGFRGALPILAREDVYCAISFNNKMTQGLLGGAIYGLPREQCRFETQTSIARWNMQMNMRLSYIKQNVSALREYTKGRYHIPNEEEKSICEGKYSVAPLRIYKLSLAAACLGLRNWGYHESVLKANVQSLFSDNNDLHVIRAGENPIPLYIPIARDDNIMGRYPLKGRYWTKTPCPQYQNQMYIVSHNAIKVHRT